MGGREAERDCILYEYERSSCNFFILYPFSKCLLVYISPYLYPISSLVLEITRNHKVPKINTASFFCIQEMS